jgi:hypothetical protein
MNYSTSNLRLDNNSLISYAFLTLCRQQTACSSMSATDDDATEIVHGHQTMKEADTKT